MIRTLLDGGADVNARDGNGEPPLQEAVDHSRLAAVQFLIENGADPHLMSYRSLEKLRQLATQWAMTSVLERLD
jgi:ankyrin repeat protein